MTQLIDLSTLTPAQRTAYWAHELYIDGVLITEKMTKRPERTVYKTVEAAESANRLSSVGAQECSNMTAA
jgi:hypothetical protein